MITSRQQFTAAIAALNLSEVTAVMARALDLMHYAPVEVEAYKQANDEYRKGKTKRSKAPPRMPYSRPLIKPASPRALMQFLADFRALSQHRRDAMTAAWRGMSEADILRSANNRTKIAQRSLQQFQQSLSSHATAQIFAATD